MFDYLTTKQTCTFLEFSLSHRDQGSEIWKFPLRDQNNRDLEILPQISKSEIWKFPHRDRDHRTEIWKFPLRD